MPVKCRICANATKEVFRGPVLKYEIQYHYCESCRFLMTEDPYWLAEAYKEPINVQDTGIMSRNLVLANVTSSIIHFLFDRGGAFVDFAGGYGLFTRLMRDVGFDFYWRDAYTPNLVARGFEWHPDRDKPVELITCFEAFEHFVDPHASLEEMLKISRNILLSTTLLPQPVPQPGSWWYYGAEHGQHIAFYSREALERLAAGYGLRLYTNGKDVHLFTDRRLLPSTVSLLYWAGRLGLGSYVRVRSRSLIWDDYLLLSNRRV